MQLVTWLRTLTTSFRPGALRTRRNSPRPRQPARQRLLLEALEDRVVPSTTDFLYVGDGINNTVQRFDATTGAALGTFVKGDKSLDFPLGMVFDGQGHFLLVNQNANRGKAGEILQYDATSGQFLGELVPFQSPDAPFAPRGMVLKDNILYVASLQTSATSHGITPSGQINAYNATTGAFLGGSTPPATLINGLADQQFNPRGLVFGPDGNLYVSAMDLAANANAGNAGYILQLNETTHPGAWSIVAFNNGDTVADPGETADLHRPEGLVFGPDGRLYVTSFQANDAANGNPDTDKILVFNSSNGSLLDKIDLDAAGPNQPRADGQALLFGPDGHLFLPITGSDSETGAVRSYDVVTKSFTDFVAPGTMGQPLYLTFGTTNPATLAYTGIAPSSTSTDIAPSTSTSLNQVVAGLAQPLGTPAASTVGTTLPGGPQTGSVPASGSSTAVVAATLSAMPLPAVSAAAPADLLFAALVDDLFAVS